MAVDSRVEKAVIEVLRDSGAALPAANVAEAALRRLESEGVYSVSIRDVLDAIWILVDRGYVHWTTQRRMELDASRSGATLR